MAIFALSDLHLSFNKKVSIYNIDEKEDIMKPMDIFGWKHHYDQIRDHWLATVKENDTVLIHGDLSWALRLEVAINDFHWLQQLPGRKVISPGNHCYYAHSKKKVRKFLPENIKWIDADFTRVEDVVVAATRGWILPGDRFYKMEKDDKIYQRQVGRLRLALEAAHRCYPNLEKIVMLHFPPLTTGATESKFMEVMEEYKVSICVYGHLHGKFAVNAIENGGSVQLKLVACDVLKFCPIQIRP